MYTKIQGRVDRNVELHAFWAFRDVMLADVLHWEVILIHCFAHNIIFGHLIGTAYGVVRGQIPYGFENLNL